MNSRKTLFLFLACLAAGLVAMAVMTQTVAAASAGQDGYPPPDEGYPGPGDETPPDQDPYPAPETGVPASPTPEFPVFGTNTPTLTPAGGFSPTAPGSITPGTHTVSPAPNLFGTEDAEIGRSLVTPPPSETPQPSETLTPTLTPTHTPEAASGFQLDRSYFLLGLLVPLGLGLVGWLSYRLIRIGEFKES